jgi:exonuclease SbcC
MLPLKLSVTGLYSYQKKQTIDFTELTSAGLFGIFGAVGSGKSSVLEAIGFVLYGETERLNSRDKRSYNMLNLKSDRANIDFEFLNFEERKFKFVADWKRNKKRFEETTTVERLAYEWIEGEWIPMASAMATPIIGLTYDNFRRTIIIPQGKFKEFLDLKGKERSEMMKEIFHLEHFDLGGKVSSLLKDTKSKLDVLKGKLSGFEGVTTEIIVNLQAEVTLAEAELNAFSSKFILIESEVKKLTLLKSNVEELAKRKDELSVFLAKKPSMDSLQAEIDVFEKAEKVFKGVLINFKTEKTNLKGAKERCVSIEANSIIVKETIDRSELVLKEILPQYTALEKTKNRVLDLDTIIQILDLQSKVALIDDKIKSEDELFLVTENKEKELKQALAILQTELNTLKPKRMESKILLEIGSWYDMQVSIQGKAKEKERKIKIIQGELASHKATFIEMNLPIETWENELDSKLNVLKLEKAEAKEIEKKLLVSKELARFSNAIHDGENCPLCGSLEHPNVMHVEDVTEQLASVVAVISKVEEKEKEVGGIASKAEKVAYSLGHSEKELALVLAEKEVVDNDLKSHLSKFVWTEFDSKDDSLFVAKKEEQTRIDIAINDTEQKEKSIRLALEVVSVELNRQRNNKVVNATEKATKSGVISNLVSQLKIVAFADYEQIAIPNISAEKSALHQENVRIEKLYQSTSDFIGLQKQELATLSGSLESLRLQVISSEKLVSDINNNIVELLEAHQFDSVETVRGILNNGWDVEIEKNKTKQFAFDLQIAINGVVEYENLVGNQLFDKEVFDKKTLEFEESKLKRETQIGKCSSLQGDLDRMNAEFAAKAVFLSEFKMLETRDSNLGTLANMFSGNGFVNYVSSIYLQNLSDAANIRFHRMTKNQLSLTVNSSNEFEVVDYLNNGASRSVKTLSGGQGFQASLCLALALAESVQSLNKNDKNFFFIDEGFGTQDPESVAVVFETLQSLNRENRIVGIISHVGELQERIPRSINVVKDEVHGSVVIESWN